MSAAVKKNLLAFQTTQTNRRAIKKIGGLGKLVVPEAFHSRKKYLLFASIAIDDDDDGENGEMGY